MKSLFKIVIFLSCLYPFTIFGQNSVDFNADITEGCNALAAVQFNDLSTGNINSWHWDFGNNTTSTLRNPVASYSQPGFYTVSLTVNGSNGSLTETKNAFIKVYNSPSSDFTLSSAAGCVPFTVVYSDKTLLGDAGIEEYIWDFGDGSPEVNQTNPSYTYPASGNYHVSLQVTDSNGCKDVKTFSSINVVDRPTPYFSASNNTRHCSAPYTVHFTNHTVARKNKNFYWDFGDGNTSTAENPSHTYTNLGNYDVRLIAENQYCRDTTVIFDFVTLESISASFDIKDTFCLGDTIYFEALTTGASDFKWDFGDGTSSIDENPFKIYQDSGYYEINLTANSATNCTATFKDTIYIKRLISDFTVPEDTLCMVPQTLNFTNNSNYGNKYTWLVDTLPLQSTPLADDFQHTFQNFQSSNMVYLEVADTNLGCQAIDSQYVFTYFPSSTITRSKNSLIEGCAPLSGELDFIYGFNNFDSLTSYSWIIDPIGDTLNQRPMSYTFNTSGDYLIILRTENKRGCVAFNYHSVSVGEKKPAPTFALEDTICAGSDEFFKSPTLLNDSFEYHVFFNYKNGDSSLYTYKDTNAPINYLMGDTGLMYIQSRITYNGCTNKGNMDSVYVQGPYVSFSAFSECSNTMTFDFDGEIYGDYSSFEWDFGYGTATNSTDLNPRHTFPNPNITYMVTFTAYNSDSSCFDSDTLKVSHTPPPDIELLSDRSHCLGDSAYISTTAFAPSDTIFWYINDSLLGVKDDFLKVSRNTIGTIDVKTVVKTQFNCVDSSEITLSFSKPEAGFDFVYNDGCIPFEVEFQNTSKNNLFIIDTVFWDIKPWGLDTNPPLITRTVDTSMVISAQMMVRDHNGCRDTLSRDSLLVVKENKLLFWANDRQLCVGDSIHFENFSTINDSMYRWTFGDGDTTVAFDPKHVYQHAGDYTISMKYLNDSLCDQELEHFQYVSVQEYPTAAFTADTTKANCYPLPVTFTDQSTDKNIHKWKWNFGDGVSSVFQNPFHNYTSVGEFDVSLRVETTNGCADTIAKPQYIHTSGPTAEISLLPDSGCMDQMFMFKMENISKVSRFQWNFGDGHSGVTNPAYHIYDSSKTIHFTLIISDSASECVIPIEDSLYIYDVQAFFEMSDTLTCVNSSVQFNNISIGAKQLEWDFGDGNTSNLTNPQHAYPNPGTYTISLAIVGENDCTDTIRKTLEIKPTPDIQIIRDTFICLGDTLPLWASGGVSYQWMPNRFLNDPNISDPLAFPDTNTRYTVRVENQFGCIDSTSVGINVIQPPQRNFFEDTLLIIGESVQLFSNNPDHHLDWQPPLWLDCYTCADPVAQPMKTTRYSLNTSDKFGCFSMVDSILIKVKEAYSVNVPSAFTPNGDGNNDVVYVRGWGIKDLLEFKIYNRWGELVFESSDVTHGWDGFYKNTAQDVETYVYTVKALMYNNQTFQRKGNISLLR